MRRGSVVVWGGISYTGRTDLVVVNANLTADRYMNLIVDPYIIPFLNANRPGFVLQQDNARPHVVRNHFQHNIVDVFHWPAVSPDIAQSERVG